MLLLCSRMRAEQMVRLFQSTEATVDFVVVVANFDDSKKRSLDENLRADHR